MTDEKNLKPDLSLWGRTRDNIACRIANFALNRIATRWYSGMVKGSIRLGLVASQDTCCGYEWGGRKEELMTRTYTVIGAWIDDQPVAFGAVEGAHRVGGGESWEMQPWATTVRAGSEEEAVVVAVREMDAE